MGAKGKGNRQRIIAAADDLFYRRGFTLTSFQDISDATGIPRGNFYYYFKTKEEILNAVLEHRITLMKQELSKCDADIADPQERLLYFINNLVTSSEELFRAGCPTGTMCTELAKEESPLQEKAAEAFVVLVDWFEQQFKLMNVNDTKQYAMNLLNKIEGSTVIANVFKDLDYHHYCKQEMSDWIRNIR